MSKSITVIGRYFVGSYIFFQMTPFDHYLHYSSISAQNVMKRTQYNPGDTWFSFGILNAPLDRSILVLSCLYVCLDYWFIPFWINLDAECNTVKCNKCSHMLITGSIIFHVAIVHTRHYIRYWWSMTQLKKYPYLFCIACSHEISNF